MRALFLTNFYPPYEIGGYEQWCQEIAAGLRERGHQVEILTSNHGVAATHNGEAADTRRVLHLQADLHYYRPTDFFLKRVQQERSNLQQLHAALQHFQPEVILVWGMWNLSLNLPYWAEQWRPGRVAYYLASYWPNDVDPHKAYWGLSARRSITEMFKRPLRTWALAQLQKEGYPPPLKFEHVACCSHYVRKTLVKAGKLPPSAQVLYGGVEPEPFLSASAVNKSADNRPLRLLYFGRLIRDKGVHTAIEAMGLLKQRGECHKLDLTILGSGHPGYEAYLRTRVAQLGIEDHVSFQKQVPRPEIPQWLRNFDVYLFTSIWPEPMARSVMEAMAAGLLVIGTEVGGQPEMLDNGINSLTFRADDAADLATQIACAAEQPALRHRLAQAGQASMLARFTLKRMVDDMECFLDGILCG